MISWKRMYYWTMQNTIRGHYHLLKCYLESISPPVVVCPIHSKYARGTMNECYWRNILKANINYMVLTMNLMRMFLIVEEVFWTIGWAYVTKYMLNTLKASQRTIRRQLMRRIIILFPSVQIRHCKHSCYWPNIQIFWPPQTLGNEIVLSVIARR